MVKENGMIPKHTILLLIDSLVNIILGILLLCFPLGLDKILGVPPAVSAFYPTLLGGVILGIGMALFLEVRNKSGNTRGLGLTGAIAINFCGAGVLLIWLLASPPDIPMRGRILLWGITLVVLGIGGIELVSRPWKNNR